MIKEWYREYSESDCFINKNYYSKKMIGFVIYTCNIGLFNKSGSPINIEYKNIEDFIYKYFIKYIYVENEILYIELLIEWLRWLCKTSKLTYSYDIELNLKKLKSNIILKNWNEKNKFSTTKSLILEAKSAGVDLNKKDEIIEYFIECAYYDKDYINEFLNPPWPLFFNGIASYLYDWKIIV